MLSLLTTGGKIKWGIIIALVLALITLGWLYRKEVKKVAQQSYQIMQQMATIDDLNKRIEDLEKNQKKTLELMSKSHKEKERIRNKYKNIRKDIQELRRRDENYKKWSNNTVPNDVNSILYSNSTNNN